MDDCAPVRCCGQDMARISVTKSEGALTLHTCVVCGRHGWQSEGRPVDREALLETVRRTPRRRGNAAADPVTRPARRPELVRTPGAARGRDRSA